MRVMDKHHTFSGEVPILRWMYRITTNLCLNRIRQRNAHPVVSDPASVQRLLAGSRSQDDRQSVLQILDKTDELTQAIVIYTYVDGMRMEDAAQMVGKSRKTVSRKLERFRAKAQRMLA